MADGEEFENLEIGRVIVRLFSEANSLELQAICDNWESKWPTTRFFSRLTHGMKAFQYDTAKRILENRGDYKKFANPVRLPDREVYFDFNNCVVLRK